MISRSILVLPRLFLGVIFALAVFPKVTNAATFPQMLGGFLGQLLPHAHPLYQAFANAVILPNLGTFAVLTTCGEVFIAVSMLFGVATRLGAAVAIFQLLNYMFAKGMALWTPSSNDAADIVLAVVVGVAAAGRVFGVDRILAEKWPKVPLW